MITEVLALNYNHERKANAQASQSMITPEQAHSGPLQEVLEGSLGYASIYNGFCKPPVPEVLAYIVSVWVP